MKRGEIYYIQRRDTIGAEIMKARPGVIVSCDALNATSEVVEVVYLTTQPKKDMPTHVTIQATGVISTALCEHIDHVSTQLLGDFCGTCSAEEMADIDKALLWYLGIKGEPTCPAVPADDVELVKITTELDVYKTLVDKILRQGVCGV